jgi:hypothetical protein
LQKDENNWKKDDPELFGLHRVKIKMQPGGDCQGIEPWIILPQNEAFQLYLAWYRAKLYSCTVTQ